ncbi:TIR domain-containing protein [Tessaracoccus rhinocerotis]|nr:TIR domain-containing protein [Tessaracoccus rhinocerotis]
MARNVTESVFVVWGGNQALARLVGNRLHEQHFSAVVGGGQPSDMFIGSQILSQIHQCTRAIILVEDTSGAELATGYNLSDNLMFEWGYITGTFPPNKVHVFLIDISARDLPSDLAGSWASEVVTDGMTPDEVADRITSTFKQDASHKVEMDKLEVMHMWTKVLRYVETYNDKPECSDIELAHYLLHSIETCYYYMAEERFEELLDLMRPVSSVLEYAVAVVKANIRLFRETGGLQRALPFDAYMELKTFFERPYDVAFQDLELDLWFQFFAVRRLALLQRTVAENPDFGEEDRRGFLRETISLTQQSLELLEEIVGQFPQQATYSSLYRGYLHRDLYLLHLALGDEDSAAEAENRMAVQHKESFYLAYKSRYPQDAILVQHLAQEYYLALAEQLEYVQTPIEKMMIRKTINGFLSKLEQDTGRQHVLLSELRSRLS